MVCALPAPSWRVLGLIGSAAFVTAVILYYGAVALRDRPRPEAAAGGND